jgi:hypothetical protein
LSNSQYVALPIIKISFGELHSTALIIPLSGSKPQHAATMADEL